ncbi:hypothetical protein ABT213_31965 [Streptomyces sp. NPDC001674]|uniref:hypothetical protein n=1 Tax=Streptomyces sp. NPDC001674 TaxID=3154394 RepID=UPI003326ED31
MIGVLLVLARMVIAEDDPQKSYLTRVGALDPATGKLAYADTMVMPDGGYFHRSGALYAYDSDKVMSVGPVPRTAEA